MTARRVGLLILAALIVIGGALLLTSTRQRAQSPSAGSVVLPELQPAVNTVSEIRVLGRGGERTTLRRRETDWIVVERDYPADSGRVRKLLLDLAALAVVEEKTSEPANYPQLGVQDVDAKAKADPQHSAGARVEVVTPAETFSLIVGKPSGARTSFVRVADSPQSLLARPQVSVDADPSRWIDRTLVEVPQERVREVAVAPAAGPAYTVSRSSREQADFTVTGLPKGRTLSAPGAANMVAGAVASLSLSDVKALPAEAPQPTGKTARTTVRTFDGLELEVHGRQDGERRYVTLSARATEDRARKEAQALDARTAGREFEISVYEYDALFRPLEELLLPKGS